MSRHIFVDDEAIARKSGVRRRVHAAAKIDRPVIVGDQPWEREDDDRRVYVYGTVLGDDAGGYRMWYNHASGHVLHATSGDGLHWEKPHLGLVEHDGSRDNNILPVRLHSPSVIHAPADPDPDARYKMLGCGIDGVRGYRVAHSGDGKSWRFYDRNPVLAGSDTCTLAHDAKTASQLAFHKLTHGYRGHRRRLVYLAASADMQRWTEPVLAMAPDEIDDEMVRAEGGICSQFYNMSAFAYGDQWLGLVTHFRYARPTDGSGWKQSPHDGPIDVQMVHSRDGRTWNRCEDRSPVIANGPHPYDAGCILGVANAPVISDDKMWIYYTAITTTHGGSLPVKEVTIARASWRIDGWVSLEAGSAGGVVETVPVHPDGEVLWLNADAAGGDVRVEVLDVNGAGIPGYGASDCLPVHGDHPRTAVRWRDHETLPPAPIALRFHLQNARIFGWWAS